MKWTLWWEIQWAFILILHTKRAWLHLLQVSLKRHFIWVRLFQTKHQSLSQREAQRYRSIHSFSQGLNLPNSSDLQENGLSYLRTVQPFQGRNHFLSRLILPSSSLIRTRPVEYLVSCLPLQYTVFTVPSGYSRLLNCIVWISFWPLLNNTVLSPFLKEIAMTEAMRRRCLLLTYLTELSNVTWWKWQIMSTGNFLT